MSIKYWCLGFVFSNSLRHVALIKKARSLHIGLWNGLGGTIEGMEGFNCAMSREAKEEEGFKIHDWIRVGDLMGDDWNVAVFTYHDKGNGLCSLPLSQRPIILHDYYNLDKWDPDKLA